MWGIAFRLIFPFGVLTPILTKQIYQFSCCHTITVIRAYIITTLIFFIFILFGYLRTNLIKKNECVY